MDKITKKTYKKMTSREIVEFITLEQELLKDEREYKYFLGSIVAKNILNQSEEHFLSEGHPLANASK